MKVGPGDIKIPFFIISCKMSAFKASDSTFLELKHFIVILIGYPIILTSRLFFSVILFQPSNNVEPNSQHLETVFFSLISSITAIVPAIDRVSLLLVDDTHNLSKICIYS